MLAAGWMKDVQTGEIASTINDVPFNAKGHPRMSFSLAVLHEATADGFSVFKCHLVAVFLLCFLRGRLVCLDDFDIHTHSMPP